MKFSGKIGFLVGEKETSPGCWNSEYKELPYVGDVIKNHRRLDQKDKVNPDLSVNNRISILSDLYAQQNWHTIRYLIWNGVKWNVSGVELEYPRLTLDLGGVYAKDERRTSRGFM